MRGNARQSNMRGNLRQLNMRGNPRQSDMRGKRQFWQEMLFAVLPQLLQSSYQLGRQNRQTQNWKKLTRMEIQSVWKSGGSTHDSKVMVFYFLLFVILHSSSDSVRVWKVSMNKLNLKCNINSTT